MFRQLGWCYTVLYTDIIFKANMHLLWNRKYFFYSLFPRMHRNWNLLKTIYNFEWWLNKYLCLLDPLRWVQCPLKDFGKLWPLFPQKLPLSATAFHCCLQACTLQCLPWTLSRLHTLQGPIRKPHNQTRSWSVGTGDALLISFHLKGQQALLPKSRKD